MFLAKDDSDLEGTRFPQMKIERKVSVRIATALIVPLTLSLNGMAFLPDKMTRLSSVYEANSPKNMSNQLLDPIADTWAFKDVVAR